MQKLIKKALKIRNFYKEFEKTKYGRSWTPAEIAQGFVGDVGDLQKLVMGKSGIRDIEYVDKKLGHELSDCLWSIIVLADEYGIDLEKEFEQTMDELEDRIKTSSQTT